MAETSNAQQPGDGSNEDVQGQASIETATRSKRQKSRHRASIACAACRERRIRCVVPDGESSCTQCLRGGTECIIKNDDERRRPVSRAYMSTLTDRVALLESMLREKGVEAPPVTYPPKTTRGALHVSGDESPTRGEMQPPQPLSKSDPVIPEGPSPGSVPDDSAEESHNGSNASINGRSAGSEHLASGGTPVAHLLSKRGHLSFDQLSGRLRFYGGTSSTVLWRSEADLESSKSSPENLEQARRAEKCIRTLPIETHDYLMQLFWQHYNAVLHVVHEEAFNEDREQGRNQFYSGFLHVCILAMAYRFADKSRPDIQRLSLPDRESTLHREAKYMLDLELERPGGIPSIAALLILGDSEVGVGRDNVGYLYSGMAMRLCYDIGLQLDSRQVGLSQREMDIRRMTLWACVIYDRYWSLFLGRPLTMKIVDLDIYSLSDQFERLGTCMPAGREKSTNTKIYEALIELMEIAGKIVEHAEFRHYQHENENVRAPDQQAYFKMASLDRDLHNWASRLPADLRYTEENRASAPYSFYLLHQQYHAVLILLHRPFARYDDPNRAESDEVSALDSHCSRASRAICTKSAITMARIFWQHRQKFDGKMIFCVGMQHAGAAATALIAALAYMPNAGDRKNNMQYLEVLHAALQDMAPAYQPAERMAAVLEACMVELRGGPVSPGRSATIPARRGSSAMEGERPSVKRRQTDRLTKRNGTMQPPSSSRHRHRVSEPIIEHNVHSRLPESADYVAVPPRTGFAPRPNLQIHDAHQAPAMLPTPDTNGMSSPERRQEWINQLGTDFPQVQPIHGIPDIPESDIASLEFLHLPSDDDWAKWHSAATCGNVTTDLDGFTPRGRFQVNAFASPPMSGIING